MNTRQIIRFGLIGIFVMVIVGASIMTVYADPQGGSNSLINASVQDIKVAAEQYTRDQFQVLSATIEVSLVRRPVTLDELPSLIPGFPEIDPTHAFERPPYALVIVKGEFDVQSMRGSRLSNGPIIANYITYVYDLVAGTPSYTHPSDGAGLGVLLNDPSLPPAREMLDLPPDDLLQAPPPEPTISPDQRLPYGSMLPGLPTPESGVADPADP